LNLAVTQSAQTPRTKAPIGGKNAISPYLNHHHGVVVTLTAFDSDGNVLVPIIRGKDDNTNNPQH